MRSSEDTNPYEPSQVPAASRRTGGVLSWCALGVWFSTLIGLLVGGETLIHTAEDFDVELPVVTTWLLSPLGIGFVALSTLIWTVVLVSFSNSGQRSILAGIALATGLLTGLLTAFLVLSPLLSLMKNLS